MASESAPDPASDLSWLAFCYVAGELGRDEAEAFEGRLDHDQSAREAVAEAVVLAGAIARLAPAPRSALPLPRSAPLTPRRLRTGTVVRVLAAGLAAAACLTWLLVGPTGPVPESPVPEVANAEPGPDANATATSKPSVSLPLAWSKLRFEGPGAREDEGSGELLAWNDEPLAPPEAELLMPDEGDEASDPALPLWLLDAASLAGRREPGVVGESVQEH